jgi:hypothetical protein
MKEPACLLGIDLPDLNSGFPVSNVQQEIENETFRRGIIKINQIFH